MQADEDTRCRRGHQLSKTTGDQAPPHVARHFTCEACAAIELAEHQASRDVRDAEGDAFDLVAGRNYYAIEATEEVGDGD